MCTVQISEIDGKETKIDKETLGWPIDKAVIRDYKDFF